MACHFGAWIIMDVVYDIYIYIYVYHPTKNIFEGIPYLSLGMNKDWSTYPKMIPADMLPAPIGPFWNCLWQEFAAKGNILEFPLWNWTPDVPSEAQPPSQFVASCAVTHFVVSSYATGQLSSPTYLSGTRNPHGEILNLDSLIHMNPWWTNLRFGGPFQSEQSQHGPQQIS